VFLQQNCNKFWIMSFFFLFSFFTFMLLICLEKVTKQNINLIFLPVCCRHYEEEDWRNHYNNLTDTWKMKISEVYDLFSKLIIKIEIWSRKPKKSLLGVWHNGNLSQDTSIITMKLNDAMKSVNLWYVRFSSLKNQRMEEYLSHVKTKKFRSIIHQMYWNLGFTCV
jgi:hypothetical protein